MWSEFDIWLFLAGLGVFLFGLFLIEEALKNIVGRTFKKFLRKQTTNPIKGVLSGMLVTAILQSSSVVSLMVLAFVGAGILNLTNALGIIFGSNLGTTFTGWIVATLGFQVDIESFALPLVAIGGLALMFLKNVDKLRELGKFLFGFGFLFIGLSWMKESIEYISTHFDLSAFEGIHPYLFFLIGVGLTALIQSSSATMVITLGGLSSGVIGLESAAALVIGSDLGTTVTVILGAINGSAEKKQVAGGHFFFNLFTDITALILLYPLIHLLEGIIGSDNELILLVAFHSSFNLLGILMLLPFIKLFAKLLTKYLSEGVKSTAYINKVPTDVPEAAIEASRKEIEQFAMKTLYLNLQGLHISHELFTREAGFTSKDYNGRYDELKQLEGEIVDYYLQIQRETMSDEESDRLNQLIHALRSGMQSAKNIKDITHNTKAFESSSNDVKFALYKLLKSHNYDFYLDLHKCLSQGIKATTFEALISLKRQNHKSYEKFLKETYKQANANSFTEIELSTLLNVNREVYSANTMLIEAIKDLLLSVEEAKDFSRVPDMHD